MVKASSNMSDNRWFIWTIVFLVVSGVSLVSYIAITDINESSNIDTGIVTKPKLTQPSTTKPVMMKHK